MRSATLFVLACGLFLAREASAAIPLKFREQLKPLAKQLTDIVKEEGQTSIAVGDFTGPAQFTTNFSGGIRATLIQEMEALAKDIVNPSSILSVKGDYEYIQGKELNEIQLTLVVKKNTGEKVGQLAKKLQDEPLRIKDSDLIATMTGRTIDLPPTHNREQLNERIKKNVEKPSFHKDGTRIAVKPGAKFAIELLVAKEEQTPKNVVGWARVPAREPSSEKGQPFVDIKPGEMYALKIHNSSGHQAAVSLLIDGIDVFTFSEIRTPEKSRFPEGRPRYSYFIVPPGESYITGWHVSNDEADSFLVTRYGKGAASKLPNVSAGKTGVITVCFALAWEGDDVPEEERGSRNAGGNETGFGPRTEVKLKEVQRKIGVVREVISVRYSH